MRRLLLLIALAAGCVHAEPAPDLTPLKDWFARQKSFRTIQADFSQSRSLRTLKSPLRTKGRFWFRAPDSFRWQTGDPPRLIVLGEHGNILVVQPKKMQAGRFSFERLGGKAETRGLDLMTQPLRGTFEDFQKQCEVRAMKVVDGICHVEFLPRDAQARRYVAGMSLSFDVRSGHLLDFTLAARDGSSIRTDFTNSRINAPLDPSLFRVDLTGYQVRDGNP